jgi:hypothetical protein
MFINAIRSPQILTLALVLFVFTGQAKENRGIENEFLAVQFDSGAQTFTIHHKPSKRTFIRDGAFEGGKGSVKVGSVTHPELGKGNAIIVNIPSGNVFRMAVYPGLPFVVFDSKLRNRSQQPTVLTETPLFRSSVDAGSGKSVIVSGPATEPLGGLNRTYQTFAAIIPFMQQRGLVGGWVAHNPGSGVIVTGADGKLPTIMPRLDFGNLHLKPGAQAAGETFALGWFEDACEGLEDYGDLIKRVYRIKLPPRPPVGLCTWYMEPHGMLSFAEKDLAELRDVAEKELKPFGFEFLMIDDGWQKGTVPPGEFGPGKQFLNVHTQKFPSGMKEVAESIRGAGLTPALWYMPFAGEVADPYFKIHPDWFIRRRSKETFYQTRWGGTCLEATVPEVQDYMCKVAGTLSRDWGYPLLKMDGLYMGCGIDNANATAAISNLNDAVYKNTEKTNIEAFRDGLKLVRKAVGPDTFLLGCNVRHSMRTLGGAFGLVDAMRIGPDTQAEMSAGASSGSRVWFLNGRVWWNDPDCVSIRPQRGSLDKARRDASWPAISGQLFYVSDWLPSLPAERLEVLKRCMPSHGLTTARPLDVFQDWQPGIWRLTDTRYGMRRDVVGLFRWGGEKEYSLTPAYLGLPKAPRYVGFDFWKNTFLTPFSDKLGIQVAGGSCAVLAIRPEAVHPQLISTSRHVTQGIVDVTDERWDAATKTLSGVSAVVGNDPYELRIVLPADGAWKAAAVELSAEDAQAAVTLKMIADGVNLRVKLSSAASRAVRWKIRFVVK